jgi:hypothetical protein
MERKRKIIAALADLKQDLAGPIPVSLISKWISSSKDPLTHDLILKPYEKRGYLAASDSSGLSRLTAERDLVEVLNIVSQPKEIIYSHGIKIGGRGVGTWCADNTEMFYDEAIPAELILEQMAAAQKRIHQQLLQVGLAIHKGVFWEINGGMFGPDAVMLEEAAENETDAKEIMLSETVREILQKKFHGNLSRREDLNFTQAFYSLNYDDLEGSGYELNFRYPLPFSLEFYKAMKHYGISEEAKKVIGEHFVRKTVVLAKVYHQEQPLLLEELTEWAVINTIVNEIAGKYDLQTIKSNGDLGIFVTDSEEEALQFAEELLLTLRKSQDMVSIGVASGEVMIFGLDQGGMDIAGGPVNIASKISEDIAEKNTLYVHDSVDKKFLNHQKFEPFEMSKSNVLIRGYRYKE